MKKCLILVLTLGWAGVPAVSVPPADAGFRTTRLGDRAALIQIGGDVSDNVVVLASRRGLVVVDTGMIASQGAALRAEAERIFGRRDFAYVVNTHSHFDHVDGNQAFADVPIIAHRNAVSEMRAAFQAPGAIANFLRRREGYQATLEGALKQAPAGSREEADIRAQLARNGAMIADFRDGRVVPTLPTVLFDDRMSVDLGDLTLNLIYFGRAHTASDILVHVPELRLLMVGDLFNVKWLPMFQGDDGEVRRWFQALDRVTAGPGSAEQVVCGHEGLMTGEELKVRVDYLRGVWDGVAAAREKGRTLAETKADLPFDPTVSAFARVIRRSQGRDLHESNIDAAWRLQSESAAGALESLIAARGLNAAVAEYKKSVAGNERYNVSENELNALGYRFLQSGRTAEALAVMEIMAAAFPGSWNAWDSLAEANMLSGNMENAEQYYRKSVELNPRNQNGKDRLSLVAGFRLDAAGETKAPLKYGPGAGTGLQGPYLGQTPPGLKPEVFAPGIVSSAGAMEFSVAFTPDGKEMYFCRRVEGGQNRLMVTRLGRDGWTAPEEAAFAMGHPATEPFITPDGRKLYFGGSLKRPGAQQAEYAIWVVERAPDGAWGEPRWHGPGMYVSAARNGNLYMTDVTGVVSREGSVVVYPWTGDRYGQPKRVGGGVNAPAVASHAFIAPDESWILFDSDLRPGGQGGEGDLYVCFKKPDGSWSEAVNLGGEVNTPGTNFCPMVTPDGKYIFYSMNRDLYWVSAEILAPLKVKALTETDPSKFFKGTPLPE